MTLRRRAPATRTLLHMDDVYVHVTTRPLTTVEITEYCQRRHPGATTQRVRRHLDSLQRRARIQSWPCTDHTALAAHGIDEPVSHARYWALPDPQEPR